MTTALVDLGVGNLHSAQKAFERMARDAGGEPVIVTDRPEVVAAADRIVLPGDGAFPHVRERLDALAGMEEAIREAVDRRGRPLFGICVGMQLLAEQGFEGRQTPGLGYIAGAVRRITPGDPSLPVPHMGWNDLLFTASHPVTAGLADGDHAYFVHSWHMEVAEADRLVATADYAGPVTAIVATGTVIGTQFHPEKSQAAGLRMISDFLTWAP